MATTKVIPGVLDLNEATSESGLKIPTGTEFNRPATDVAGMVRNNTNETSDSSASCEEYYNGTAWQKINNVPLPVYFRTVLYTGNDVSHAITGVGFKPDWVWIKRRNDAESSAIYDSTRGINQQLESNSDAAQATNTAPNEGFTSFDNDGFTVGNNGGTNRAPYAYVAWCWKANGGTTSSNTDGSSTSTVQVNSDAGFSIVQYVGNQTAGHTIGHGLGATPEVVIIKCINVARPWYVYHVGVDATNPADYNLRLNAPDARQDSTTEFNDTEPTSTVFTLGTASGPNGTGDDYIAYCFTPIAGYSNFGSYTGDGTTGQAITTVGFELTWVLIKSTVGTANWLLYDTVRGITSGGFLNPDNTDPETADGLSPNITVTATGFTITSGGVTQGLNSNGNLYIYLAFK